GEQLAQHVVGRRVAVLELVVDGDDLLVDELTHGIAHHHLLVAPLVHGTPSGRRGSRRLGRHLPGAAPADPAAILRRRACRREAGADCSPRAVPVQFGCSSVPVLATDGRLTTLGRRRSEPGRRARPAGSWMWEKLCYRDAN